MAKLAPGGVQVFLLVDAQGVLRMRLSTGQPAAKPEFRAALRELLPGIDWDAVLDQTNAAAKPAAPREKGPAETPEATFEAMRKAGAESDFAVYYNCQSPEFRKRDDERWEALKASWRRPKGQADLNDTASQMGVDPQKLLAMSNREFNFANWNRMPAARDRWKSAVITAKTPEPDRTVFRIQSGNAQGSLVMVRINGLWYWDPSAK
jgi:hypothetical protein